MNKILTPNEARRLAPKIKELMRINPDLDYLKALALVIIREEIA